MHAGGNRIWRRTYASWTFRKAEKFFDVVTYTGNGATQNISHNLGSTPAVIIVKGTTTNNSWCVYSSALGNTKTLFLDLTSGETTNTSIWNSTTPTDSVFSVGNVNNVNESGQTFVAYLFASDGGGFGDDGSESIIKCGSYTGTGAAGLEVDLGFEPQWLMFKRTDSTSDWSMFDVMRGIATGGDDARLRAQGSDAENTFNYVDVTATGFSLSYGGTDMNASGGTYIYIAIRRPMKTPESGTEVFAQDTRSSDSITTNFPVDAVIGKNITATSNWFAFDRLRGSTPSSSVYLKTNSTEAETSVAAGVGIDSNTSIYNINSWSAGIYYNFKRATGFFDVVAYTGNRTAGRTVAHNLGVAPELMIVKRREAADEWTCYIEDVGATKWMALNQSASAYTSASRWNNTAPTSSVFTLGADTSVNRNTSTYIAYLFATLDGVSKVGSYTGTGSNVNVDCGFSAGARFILIKRTDSTGDWYVWDSVRGIVAGNDPYLLLNSSAAEVTSTDYIDPLSSGFTVTSTAPAALNASGGTYIFLAIA